MKKLFTVLLCIGALFFTQSSFAQFDPQQADPPTDGSVGGGAYVGGQLHLLGAEVNHGLNFYEGNGGSQSMFYAATLEPGKELRLGLLTSTFGIPWDPDNDEARSVGIRTTEVGRTIVFYDAPDQNTGDDYTEVTIKKATPVGYEYVMNSFEHSYEDEYVRVIYHYHNGLDGKVSAVLSSIYY